MWQKIILCILLLCGIAHAAVNDSGVKVHWSYKGNTGPEFWARLNKSYMLCAEGKMQSPVNIGSNDKDIPNTLALHYQPVTSVLAKDASTKLTIEKNVVIFNDGRTVQLNFKDKKNYVMYEGQRYDLVALHFHSPSENQINGASAPLEAHFVHQGANGKALIIAVLIKGGASNPLLANIVKHIPKDKNQAMTVRDALVNPADLFPLDNDYYAYSGSLTAPPCSEGVEWIVMAATTTALPAEIASIRAAMGGSNTRAVQPLNKRVIGYAMEKKS